MKLVVGLGNPGTKYRNNRHNLGFWVIDRFAKLEKITLKRNKELQSYLGQGIIGGEEIVLIKPLTYMNRSGQAVREVVAGTNLPLDSLLVICDDFRLAPGKIRIRPRGSSGGHKGLDSIIQLLESEQFPRLRLGIGLPPGSDAVEYVLRDFTRTELTEIMPARERAAAVIKEWITAGIESAMNKFN